MPRANWKRKLVNLSHLLGYHVERYSPMERAGRSPGSLPPEEQAVPGLLRKLFYACNLRLRRHVPLTEEDVGPLLLSHRTFNTRHPEYDPYWVNNKPNHFYTRFYPTSRTHASKANPLFQKLYRGREEQVVFDERQARNALAELKQNPHYPDYLRKSNELDEFIHSMNQNHPGTYYSGAITPFDGLFLYWLVKQRKPSIVVQTGVSNGVSVAHIVMALAEVGTEGRLLACDLPHVYDPDDPFYHQDTTYGVIIPQGKHSGWLVPDPLADRFDCIHADARQALPTLLAQVPAVDLFYHDSDHSYDHMLYEFQTVLPAMSEHGLIVADDVSWNRSAWDFAEELGCHAYNHRGRQGVIFL